MYILPRFTGIITGKNESGYDAVIEHEWLWWKWEEEFIGDVTVWHYHKTQRRAATYIESELSARLVFYQLLHGRR